MFGQFEISKSRSEKTLSDKFFQVFVTFRPFLKPRFKSHRLLRGFWPDSHRKPCKLRGLRPLLQTGGAENSGIYGAF